MDDDHSIADVATLGWINHLSTVFGACELVEYDNLPPTNRHDWSVVLPIR